MSASADVYRNAMTSKELNYLTDHMKNESLLTQLSTQAATTCANPQLREVFARQAEGHVQHLDELMGLLHKYTAH